MFVVISNFGVEFGISFIFFFFGFSVLFIVCIGIREFGKGVRDLNF